ncbi:hypothetical protein IKF27_01770 [Candidatus Saccharibacteria bacterium]|nr:hypothetical protein [Candidatus Saccharibacteria bacterium]
MKRVKSIDILKVIGLLGIMIAHVGAPGWAIQLRGFDVILLITISVYLFLQCLRKKKKTILSMFGSV